MSVDDVSETTTEISREDAVNKLSPGSIVEPRTIVARLAEGFRQHFLHDRFVHDVYAVGTQTIIQALAEELKPHSMHLAFRDAAAKPAAEADASPSHNLTFDPTKPTFT